MRKTLLVMISLSSLLAGCGNKGASMETSRDVAWYEAHKEELMKKIAECKNNPGELAATPNCLNAQQALHNAMSGPNTVDYSSAFKK